MRPSSSSREIQKRSASCGPSIFTPSSSARILADPQWSIWPWVSSIFSIVTPCPLAAALSRSRSPPGSVKAPFIVWVHQTRQQFCCSGVTGMIATLSGGLAMAGTWRLTGRRYKRANSGGFRRLSPMRWLAPPGPSAFHASPSPPAPSGQRHRAVRPAPAGGRRAGPRRALCADAAPVVAAMLDLAEVGPEDLSDRPRLGRRPHRDHGGAARARGRSASISIPTASPRRRWPPDRAGSRTGRGSAARTCSTRRCARRASSPCICCPRSTCGCGRGC